MLEDQLLLIIGLKNDRIFVERANTPSQLDAAQQINGDIDLFFAGCVEEGILDVLRRLVFHSRSP